MRGLSPGTDPIVPPTDQQDDSFDNQTIIRAPHGTDRPYFCMARAAAQDENLSFEARGVISYLLSKPDNWQILPSDLMKEGHIGRDQTYRILNELKSAGYLLFQRIHTAKGVFIGVEYRLFEVPQPLPEKPDAGKPFTGNPQLHNTESSQSRELAAASKIYEHEIGMITSMIAEQLWEIIDEHYPSGWFEAAVMEAVEHNARNLKYVRAILDRWQREGRGPRGNSQQHEPQLIDPDPLCPICHGAGVIEYVVEGMPGEVPRETCGCRKGVRP